MGTPSLRFQMKLNCEMCGFQVEATEKKEFDYVDEKYGVTYSEKGNWECPCCDHLNPAPQH